MVFIFKQEGSLVDKHNFIVSVYAEWNGNRSLRRNCPAEITKLCLLNFHVISSNATRYTTRLDEKIRERKKQYFGEKVQDYKDWNGLRLINLPPPSGNLMVRPLGHKDTPFQ